MQAPCVAAAVMVAVAVTAAEPVLMLSLLQQNHQLVVAPHAEQGLGKATTFQRVQRLLRTGYQVAAGQFATVMVMKGAFGSSPRGIVKRCPQQLLVEDAQRPLEGGAVPKEVDERTTRSFETGARRSNDKIYVGGLQVECVPAAGGEA